MNIEKFTQKSIDAVRNAQNAAAENGNAQIEQIHLFAALISDASGLCTQLLVKMGVNTAGLQREAEAAIAARPKMRGIDSSRIYISPELEKALNAAEKDRALSPKEVRSGLQPLPSKASTA